MLERPGDLVFFGASAAILAAEIFGLSAGWLIVLALGVGGLLNEWQRKRNPY